MLGMVKDMTLEGMAGMASSMGIGGKASADPEQGKRMLITLNEMLNKIKSKRVPHARRESAEKQICPLTCAQRGVILYR